MTFVVLVGPDGAGKTSVARELAGLAAERNIAFRYVHFLPGVADPPDRVSDGTPTDKHTSPQEPTPVAVCWSMVRLVRNIARVWVGYLVGMRRRRVRDERLLFVGDRWIYNYIGQPDSVRFIGPANLAASAVRLAPAPDLVALLVADPVTVRARKPELTIDQISAEYERWSSLRLACPVVRIDAHQSPQDVAAEVFSRLPQGRSRTATAPASPDRRRGAECSGR